MKPGKVSEAVLKRAIIKQITYKGSCVKNGAAVGNDGALFSISKNICNMIVTSTETIIDDYEYQKARALYRAVNNVAAKGGKVLTVQISVTLPDKALESDLRALMKEHIDAAKGLGITISGGHTEVSENVTKPVVTVTAIGETDRNISFADVEAMDDIVLSKAVALEGTYLLAKKQKDFFLTRFSKSYVEKTSEFIKDISIIKEAEIAVENNVKAMHDLSENGVFGALWEIGAAAKLGLSVDIKKININQETIELCEYFDINPYKIPSSGALLMITKDGASLVKALNDQGIQAEVIGKMVEGNDRVIINEDETRFLEPPKIQSM